MGKSTALGRPFVKRFYTRLEAAKVLGVTVPTLHKYEKKGLYKPLRVSEASGYERKVGPGKNPTFVIRAEDVARLKDAVQVRHLGDGEIAAEAFKLFAHGQTVVEAVVRLHITPAHAEQLFERYRHNTGCILLPGAVVTELKELGFAVDPATFVPTVTRLLTAVREARAAAAGRQRGPSTDTLDGRNAR